MRQENQKLKLLHLERILREHTDDEHAMPLTELMARLKDLGVPVERKTLYSDIEALRDMGYDIVTTRERCNNYALVSREFELPELKLLIDAVQSSRFISEKKSRTLIKKLSALTSVHQARQLERQVFICNRVKSANESVYYAIDALNAAIAAGKKVRFHYYEYTPEKERRLRNGGRFYEVSPYALLWDDEYYYLVCDYSGHQGISHFRVDKMADVSALDKPCTAAPEDFDPAAYAKRVFGMFAGEECHATLRFDNSLIGVVIDRFGSDIIVTNRGDSFTTSVSIVKSPTFYGWLFQLGDKAEILDPPELRQGMKEYLEKSLAQYQ